MFSKLRLLSLCFLQIGVRLNHALEASTTDDKQLEEFLTKTKDLEQQLKVAKDQAKMPTREY